MAMIKCPECGKEISDKASSCPNCGCPMSTSVGNSGMGKISKWKVIIFSVIAIIVIITVLLLLKNKIPEGYTKEYYREAKVFVESCEKYIDNPANEKLPETGEIFDEVFDEMIKNSNKYTQKDYELAEQELYTSTALLIYSSDNEKQDLIDAINHMKELMELD